LPDCRGIFVAIVGPSGAGKDTLLSLARDALRDCPGIRFARRVITRDADGATEDHDTLDVGSFQEARTRGDFCLSWEAHGLCYGLPASIGSELAAGNVVVANMSRRSLDLAAEIFGGIDVVEITARPELLIDRLTARGRETPEEIAARVARYAPIDRPASAVGFLSIDNSDDMSAAAETLARHLRSRTVLAECSSIRRHPA
jgi:ribose 1,5-bisphosphokinase